MPLDFKFTLAQSADCETLTFTETTGNGAGGYGDGGNPLYTDVRNTQLTILLPNGDTVLLDKGYLPSTDADPNGTFDFVAGDIGFSNFLDGVWDFGFYFSRCRIYCYRNRCFYYIRWKHIFREYDIYRNY
jgi:hypothetical protein